MFLSGTEKEQPPPMRPFWRLNLARSDDTGSGAGAGPERADSISRPFFSIQRFKRSTVEKPLEGTAAVLRRHLNGDPQAFAELVKEFGPRVYGYLSRCGINPGQRDDLFQEIFLRVHRGAESFEFERPFEPWLFTIVANVARSHFRKQPRDESGELDQIASAAPDAAEVAELKETAEFIQAAIAALSLPQREVLNLAVYEKLELQQISDLLGMPLNTVKTHLRRARLALAEKLAKLALRTKREAGL